jgi:hypothetical protein
MMTKTQLIAKTAGLGLEVADKDTKEQLLEKIATELSAQGKNEELLEFLESNGFTLDDEGNVVKRTKRRSLGENPNTKAFHTITVLQDESLAHLTYPELAAYLKETEGVETTSNSIAWYANWLKSKGRPCVARAKKVKETPEADADTDVDAPVPEQEVAPSSEDEV